MVRLFDDTNWTCNRNSDIGITLLFRYFTRQKSTTRYNRSCTQYEGRRKIADKIGKGLVIAVPIIVRLEKLKSDGLSRSESEILEQT